MQFQNGYGVSEASNQHHISEPHQPQFQLFLHQHHQPFHSDPFAFNSRPHTDANNLPGLLPGGCFPAYIPPPPSVGLPPQSLWKCGTPEDYTQLGSKPKSENRLSHSPESGGEVYEAQWGAKPESQMMKRKKNNKFYREEEVERELKVLSGLIEARLVAHQESLQRRFTAAMDRMERDRKEREDAWRAADLEVYRAHAAARAHDQALAEAREAVIVSYIEKMTGEKMDLPRPETVNGSLTGSRARLEDDVRLPDSYLYGDVDGDVVSEKNEMLEALLEFKERNH